MSSFSLDLARGDYTLAGLSVVGAIPFIGEVADTANQIHDERKVFSV